MRQDYELQHSYLLQEIERCMQLDLPEKEKAERCFWVAVNHWEQLKEKMRRTSFKDLNDEIEFFRNTKPEFTSLIEYFILLSEALVCEPESNRQAILYWETEMARFRRFCDRNDEFIRYYERGNRIYDALYFSRKSGESLAHIPKAPVYDVEIEFCSSHDQYIRSYLAFKKYYDFAKAKVKQLKDEGLN